MPKKIDLSNLDHLDFPKDDDGNYLGKYVAYKNDEHGEVSYYLDSNGVPLMFEDIDYLVDYFKFHERLNVMSEDDLFELGIYIQHIDDEHIDDEPNKIIQKNTNKKIH